MLTTIIFYLDLLGRQATNSGYKVEQGAVGVRFVVEFQENGSPVDISAATTRNLCFRAPSGGDKVLSATFYTDGTDGRIYYDTEAVTLDENGSWRVSGHITAPTYERKAPSSGIFQVVSSICP